MKKIIGIVVLLVVLGGGFWLYQNFNNIAKTQTEKIATKTLGVPVKIASLDLDLKAKEIVLGGLTIGNPPGFKNDKIIKVDAIKVAADSLTNKTLVFNEIVIDGTAINLEVTQNGTNFTALQKLMAAQKSAPAKAEAAKESKPSVADSYKVVIKRLLINNATLTPSSTLTQANMDKFIMPDISMSSIGVKQGGIPPSEAVRIVVANLSDAVLKTALKSGYLEGMSKQMLQGLKMQYDLSGAVADKVKSDFKKAGEELKGLFGN